MLLGCMLLHCLLQAAWARAHVERGGCRPQVVRYMMVAEMELVLVRVSLGQRLRQRHCPLWPPKVVGPVWMLHPDESVRLY